MKEIKTLREVKDCVGKTISGCMFSNDEEAALAFTDGTVLVIRAYGDYAGIRETGGDLILGSYKACDLLEAGIVDQEYIDEQERKRAEAEAERKNRVECQERMEYMRLKRKFEGEAN